MELFLVVLLVDLQDFCAAEEDVALVAVFVELAGGVGGGDCLLDLRDGLAGQDRLVCHAATS